MMLRWRKLLIEKACSGNNKINEINKINKINRTLNYSLESCFILKLRHTCQRKIEGVK